MPKTLAILEVSQKQAFIFSSKYLKQNQRRSRAIREATEVLWKKGLTKEQQEKRLVYAGGGHIILQFESPEEAQKAVREITYRAYTDFDGMEMFAKLWKYDTELPRKEKRYQGLTAPAANLMELTRRLEIKKSLRSSAFRRRNTGLEQLDGVTFLPVELNPTTQMPREPEEELKLPPDRHPLLPEEGEFRAHQTVFDALAGNDNFIAVVHIDGNNMGARSQKVTKDAGDDWDECCAKHRSFSESVELAFRTAMRRTINLVDELQNDHKFAGLNILDEHEHHPVKPVVAAGDDICFVTAGKLGIECAAFFLRALQNPNDPQYQKLLPMEGLNPYSACAGVAIVHTKYPFHRAYELSEELCSSAKRYAAQLGQENERETDCISTIDWHIEFGQGRGSVAESREDYITEDSGSGTEKSPIRTLTLRPLAVIGGEEHPFRSYDFFRSLYHQLCDSLTDNDEAQDEGKRFRIPRSKLKGLRTPLKQGKLETKLFIRMNRLEKMVQCAWDQVPACQGDKDASGQTQESFTQPERDGDGLWRQRCLYFDAVEMVDHLFLLPGKEDA